VRGIGRIRIAPDCDRHAIQQAQKSAGGENALEISQQRTAIIWLTHFVDPAAEAAFERLAREAAGFGRVFHVRQYSHFVEPPAPASPGEISISDVDVVQAMPKRSQGIDFANGIPQGVVDLLHFAVLDKLEKFAYCWFIEYDVDFSGNWQTFFSSFQNCKADLLAATLYPRSMELNWYHWKTYAAPPSVPAQFATRGFFPVFRLSSRFADIYRAEIENAWSGHFEALYPTIARYRKLSVEDIGGSGPFASRERLNLFYFNTVGHVGLFPGTFRFRPLVSKNYYSGPSKDFPIPNKLWHPIKTNAHDQMARKIDYHPAENATGMKIASQTKR
jgi:hypothetical protein